MIINSKVIIGHDSFKNLLAQNQPNRTLYITLNHTAHVATDWGAVQWWFRLNYIVKYGDKNGAKSYHDHP